MSKLVDLEMMVRTGVVSWKDIATLRATSPGANDSDILRLLLLQALITSFQLDQIERGIESLLLGDYVIRDWIGRSGNNDLLVAKGYCDDLTYFIVLHSIGNDTIQSREEFIRGASLNAGFRHENWAQTVEVQAKSKPQFICVIRDPRARSLENFIRQGGAFSTNQSFQIAIKVVRGLLAASHVGIIHGDINPRIVMLQESYENVSLLPVIGNDWSIGHSMHVDFSSPERILGASCVSSKTDVYGVGCLLYFCLTGVTPFYFIKKSIRRQAHLGQKPYNPSQFNPNIPKRASSMIAEMMAKNPSDRPSIDEAAILLDAFA